VKMISNKKYTMLDTDLKELIARFWSAFLGHKDAIDRIDLTQQFEAPSGELVKINAAVLICLCGKKHPLFQRAWDYLSVPDAVYGEQKETCLLYTSPSPRDRTRSRMPSSA